jgi:pimeloyl-ACP methyl ester carboxylesterase
MGMEGDGMLGVTARLPATPTDRPPVILIHGAANSAGVWALWLDGLAALGWPTYALDLRGHGSSTSMDLSHTSMTDYADDVRALSRSLVPSPILIGWSMGGLVALMVAERGEASACVCLAPSAPARSVDELCPLRSGEFGPEEYGISSDDPDDQPSMPDLDREERAIALAALCRESRYARDERGRGIVVGKPRCPTLLVTGSLDAQWPRERYTNVWAFDAEMMAEDASHWGLVLNRRVLETVIPCVSDWLDSTTAEAAVEGGRSRE